MLVWGSKIEPSCMSEVPWSFWIFLLTLPCRLLCRFSATAAFSALKLPLSVVVCSTDSDNRLWTYSIWGDSHTALKRSRIKGNFGFFLQYCSLMNLHLRSCKTVRVIVQITAYAALDTFLTLWWICVKNKMLLNPLSSCIQISLFSQWNVHSQ